MPQLIMTVLALALTSASMLSFVVYANPAKIVEIKTKESVIDGFEQLESAWLSFREHNRTYGWVCETHTTAEGSYEDCAKVMTDEGNPAPGNWKNLLFPEHGFEPNGPGSMAWGYNTNANGIYFCGIGGLKGSQLGGIQRAIAEIPVGRLVASTACGETTGSDPLSLDPTEIRLTYWLERT